MNRVGIEITLSEAAHLLGNAMEDIVKDYPKMLDRVLYTTPPFTRKELFIIGLMISPIVNFFYDGKLWDQKFIMKRLDKILLTPPHV
jgi:hypothetical protein